MWSAWAIQRHVTLTELLEHIRLATVIEDTNVTDAQITVIINQGIHEVSVATQWPWLEASETITLVQDQNNYSPAADWNRTQSLVYDDNDTIIPYLAPSSYFELYGNDTGNTSTNFKFFTIWGGEILLTPIPSAADTDRLTHYYYKNPTELSAGGDTPEWDEAFHWIIVEYGKWKLYEREEYYDQSERAFLSFARYLEDMEKYYNKRVSRTPYIAGDGIHHRRGDPNIPSLRQI